MTIARDSIYNPFRPSIRRELDPSNPGLRGGPPNVGGQPGSDQVDAKQLPYESLPAPKPRFSVDTPAPRYSALAE